MEHTMRGRPFRRSPIDSEIFEHAACNIQNHLKLSKKRSNPEEINYICSERGVRAVKAEEALLLNVPFMTKSHCLEHIKHSTITSP